ncbi:MAG: aldehyde dehydrogenase family protein, partial [Candidatus Aminicenantes bacterium]|nr:aldehyde dehydrogenase family protein [Candidatus Aminicenantes bacterium]
FGVVTGGSETACEIAAHPAVRKVIFFGSPPAGRQIAEVCGRHFKPCVLELGGRNAAIVCRDADLKRAAHGLIWSAFSAAGKSCVAMKKVFVEASVFQDFVTLLCREMKAIRTGSVLDPSTDVAPQNEPTDLELNFVPEENARPDGPDLKPSLRVQKVATIEQAVEEANSYLSGLGASIWSRDLKKAGTIARRLRAGLVWVNDSSVGLPQFPWGGTREDGWGRLFAEPALTELVNFKVISVDRPAAAGRKFWWFPYSERKYQTLLALNEFLYGKKDLPNLISLFASLLRCYFRGVRR